MEPQKEILNIFSQQKLKDYLNDNLNEIPYIFIGSNNKNITIEVQFASQTTTYQFKELKDNKIRFWIVISKGFPVVAPKVYILSKLTSPAINDCRDLLLQIVPEYNIKVKLKNIYDNIPLFLQRLQQLNEKPLKLQQIGRLLHFEIYSIQFIKNLVGQLYISFHIGQQKISVVIIYLTQTHFILFTPLQHKELNNANIKMPDLAEIKNVKIKFWAQLQALKEIQINKENYLQFNFNFVSVKPRNLKFEVSKVNYNLKLAKGFQLIESVLKQVRKLQQIDLNLEIASPKTEEEIAIFNNIEECEARFKKNLNRQNIERLNEAYQTAVEYYSSYSMPYYQIFLAKISNVYTQEDVRCIMGYK